VMKHLLRRYSILASAGAIAAAVVAGCSSSDTADSENITTSGARLIARPAPRIMLTPSLLARLQARAAAGDAAWIALKGQCDGYAKGTMNPPSANAYP